MNVGLFFGTYNPIHIGHLAIANYIVEYGPIDQLWFVVSPLNPFKKKNKLLPDYQRLEMVNLAIKDDPRFQASDIEFRLPKPSYTINTLTYLAEKFPSYTFKPIMGADNFMNINKWRNHEILMANYDFLVYPRPGYDHTSVEMPDNFTVVDAPQIEVSSTFIRDAILAQKDVRYFLHSKVQAYINEMKFYM